MNSGPCEAIIKTQKSKTRYIAGLSDGKEIEVGLSAKYVMHGIELSVGAKIFVQLLENQRLDGYILTLSDFKMNNWLGWTEEYEPQL